MTKHCEWCDKSFVTDSKNQIYCSAECRALATKQKIIKRYKLTKAKERIGKERKCAGGCSTMLSAYNENSFCDNCLISNKKIDKTIKEIRGFFDYEQE